MAKGHKTGGRQKGTPNSVTTNAKGAIEECFQRLGGVVALEAWAKENQTDFYKVVWPKILPLTVAGDKENPLNVINTILNDISGNSAGLPEDKGKAE